MKFFYIKKRLKKLEYLIFECVGSWDSFEDFGRSQRPYN